MSGNDDYSILADEQWEKVLALLERDLRLNQQGMRFIAPSYPEAGQEMRVEFDLELDGFVWSLGQVGRTLSCAIIEDNAHVCRHDTDEIERAAASLVNTAAVLRAHIARQNHEN